MRAPRARDAFATALCVIAASRVACAVVNATTFDCDEAFNYWEPLHALTHGHGLQTWEHARAHALRSYAYLFAHYAPVRRGAVGARRGRGPRGVRVRPRGRWDWRARARRRRSSARCARGRRWWGRC